MRESREGSKEGVEVETAVHFIAAGHREPGNSDPEIEENGMWSNIMLRAQGN